METEERFEAKRLIQKFGHMALEVAEEIQAEAHPNLADYYNEVKYQIRQLQN